MTIATCGGDKPTFEPALHVDATVVSANTPGMVTVDAGLKAMATEEGPPVSGRRAGGTPHVFMGDEHGAIRREGEPLPGPGERVILTPRALRPDREPLRELSRGEGRHAGRDLAGHGARPLGVAGARRGHCPRLPPRLGGFSGNQGSRMRALPT